MFKRRSLRPIENHCRILFPAKDRAFGAALVDEFFTWMRPMRFRWVVILGSKVRKTKFQKIVFDLSSEWCIMASLELI